MLAELGIPKTSIHSSLLPRHTLSSRKTNINCFEKSIDFLYECLGIGQVYTIKKPICNKNLIYRFDHKKKGQDLVMPPSTKEISSQKKKNKYLKSTDEACQVHDSSNMEPSCFSPFLFSYERVHCVVTLH